MKSLREIAAELENPTDDLLIESRKKDAKILFGGREVDFGSDLHVVDLKKTLLEGLLWGLKLRGCSISTEEIDEILKMKSH